jgi:hypothetical protein
MAFGVQAHASHGKARQELPSGPAGGDKGELSSLGLVESSGHATGGDAVRVRILLQVAPDDSTFGEAEEVATFEKGAARIEEVGLSLAEGKTVLAALQQRTVELQATAWIERHRHCAACGRQLRSKGSYPIVFRSLFGDIRLASPRFHRCGCRDQAGPATISPLKDLFSDHTAPERLYLETRWASLAPYAATATMLTDVLPIGATINASTVRAHVLRVAERAESELGEERSCFIDGCPADWQGLPHPEGRIVVGLDGGYVRDWGEKTSNFEVIVGRSMPEDRAPRYLGLVHGYDRKPKRRLVDLLQSQGLQPNQDVTFLTDGGDEIKALTELISPCGEHVLDWFHIAMRLTVLGQYAKGVAQVDDAEGTRLLDDLGRLKWRLWHGDIHRALEEIHDLEDDVDGLELAYPNLGRFRRAMHEFRVYIAENAGSIINYGERYRTGERISTAFVESTVNTVIGKRFAKKQQMQWTPRGAHLLLQTRTRALDGTLRAMFERWYPGLANDNTVNTDRAAAA